MTPGELGDMTPGVFPAILTEAHADGWTQPFWDAALDGRLVAPRCTGCESFRLPPSPLCFACRRQEVEWVELPGTGTVYTFTVVRHPLHPGMAGACPYVSAVVELDGTQGAGARMIVNIVDVDPDTIAVGDRVEVVFERVSDELAVPRFRPLG